MKKILLIFAILSCIVINVQEVANGSDEMVPQEQKINDKKMINWGPYMKKLEDSIKHNWNPPRDTNFKEVVVRFAILRDGTLSSTKIIKSSGILLVDNAAIEAIQKTSPYQPLPEQFERESLPIEFTFNYNVHIQTYSSSPSYTPGTCKTKLCKFIYEHQ